MNLTKYRKNSYSILQERKNMGLDMYLYREQHFGDFDDEVKETTITTKSGKQTKITDYGRKGFITIRTNIAYWRKANCIHEWFVQNCGYGIDECQTIDVSSEDLHKLYDICKKVKTTAKLGKGLVSVGEFCGGGFNNSLLRVDPIMEDERVVGFATTAKKVKMEDLADGDYFIELGDNFHTAHTDEITYYQKKSASSYKGWRIGETIINIEDIIEDLPTAEGFFFGSTDYDEYYLADIEDTIKELDKVFADEKKLIKNGVKEYDITYKYVASW